MANVVDVFAYEYQIGVAAFVYVLLFNFKTIIKTAFNVV